MSKTTHPKDFAKRYDSSSVPDGGQFNLKANTDRNDAQASMTYMADAHDVMAVGSHGETRGFAKEIPTPKEAGNAAYALYTRYELTNPDEKLSLTIPPSRLARWLRIKRTNCWGSTRCWRNALR